MEAPATELFESVLADVRQALTADGGVASAQADLGHLLSEIKQALENDRDSTREDDVRLATEVEELIPRITDRIIARHQGLRAQFESNAPWALSALDSELDLLGPIGKADHEPTHTRVLSYLLDPNGSHGLGVRALREFFALLGRMIPGDDTYERLAQETPERTDLLRRVQVRAEQIVAMPDQERRCDLWLELVEDGRTLIVVVENKIAAEEHGDQLQAYEDAVWHQARSRRRLNFEAKLVFLTKKGHPPAHEYDQQLWLPLSHLQVAAALARAGRDAPEPGRTYLNLYVSTVLRMLGIPSSPEGLQRIRQLPYLNEFPEIGGQTP